VASCQRERSSNESGRITGNAAGSGLGIQGIGFAGRDPAIRIARGKLLKLLEAVKLAESERLVSRSPPPLAPTQGGGGKVRTQLQKTETKNKEKAAKIQTSKTNQNAA